MIAFGQVDQFVQETIGKFIDVIINPIIVMLFTISFLVFFWGIVEFLAFGQNPEKASTGKQHMLWGVIGIFIFIASIWILRLISNTVGGPDIFQQ